MPSTPASGIASTHLEPDRRGMSHSSQRDKGPVPMGNGAGSAPSRHQVHRRSLRPVYVSFPRSRILETHGNSRKLTTARWSAHTSGKSPCWRRRVETSYSSRCVYGNLFHHTGPRLLILSLGLSTATCVEYWPSSPSSMAPLLGLAAKPPPSKRTRSDRQ